MSSKFDFISANEKPALLAFSTPDWLDAQLKHIAWGGFTFWDLIMPLFLFIVGAAMPFSFSRRVEAGQGKAAIYRKIATRCLILYENDVGLVFTG